MPAVEMQAGCRAHCQMDPAISRKMRGFLLHYFFNYYYYQHILYSDEIGVTRRLLMQSAPFYANRRLIDANRRGPTLRANTHSHPAMLWPGCERRGGGCGGTGGAPGNSLSSPRVLLTQRQL